jgi:septum site-determining protein MinC
MDDFTSDDYGSEDFNEEKSSNGLSENFVDKKKNDSQIKAVSCKGTGNGLTLTIDGSLNFFDLKPKLESFLESRSSFINGSEVALEWVNQKPASGLLRSVKELLHKSFGIKVAYSKSTDTTGVSSSSKIGNLSSRIEVESDKDLTNENNPKLGLFGGIENLDIDSGRKNSSVLSGDKRYLDSRDEDSQVSSYSFLESGDEEFPSAWDDADARIIWGTLRSGQKIESDHSILIVGDVNSGAEVIAGGDIIVLGNLRGVAHAGAYDETGGGKFIFAINLNATQLRIGMVISRGSQEQSKLPEIAYMDGTNISVEIYNSRSLPKRIRT